MRYRAELRPTRAAKGDNPDSFDRMMEPIIEPIFFGPAPQQI
jgi:hypothetical protein